MRQIGSMYGKNPTVHDFYKRKTVEKTPKGVTMTLAQQIEADNEAKQTLENEGFSPEIISLTSATGSSPDAMKTMEEIVSKNHQDITSEDWAKLAIHYADDYTIGSNWVSPAEENEKAGKINDLNRRMDASRKNPKYSQVDKDGIEYYGKNTLDKQEEIGEMVEKLLAQKISETQDTGLDPKDLPLLVDEKIKEKIRGSE